MSLPSKQRRVDRDRIFFTARRTLFVDKINPPQAVNRREFIKTGATVVTSGWVGSPGVVTSPPPTEMGSQSEPFKEISEAGEWLAGSVFNLAVDYWDFMVYRP